MNIVSGRSLDLLLVTVLLAIASVLIVFSAFILQRTVFVLFGIAMLPVGVLWLYLRKNNLNMWSEEGSRIGTLSIGALFFVLLTTSIMMLYDRPDLYSRPLMFFILASIMAGLLFAEIMILPRGRSVYFLAFIQVLALGFAVQYSQIAIFPDVIGFDPWYHQFIVQLMLESGTIPSATGYEMLPMFHTLIASGSIISALDYRLATSLTITLMEVLLIPISAFLLGRYMFSAKIGMMAAALLSVAPYHLLFGVWPIPNTLASITVLLIFYILWKVYGLENAVGLLIAVFLMLMVIVTHTVGALALALLLFSAWMVYLFVKLSVTRRTRPMVSINVALLFAVAMLGWWTYVSGNVVTAAEIILHGFGSVGAAAIAPPIVTEFVYTIPVTELVFRYLGMFLFFALALIGCLYMISRRAVSLRNVTLVTMGVLILAIGAATLVFNISSLETRWFFIAEMLLAIPAVLGILSISSMSRRRGIALLIAFVMVSTVAFFAIASPTGQIDNNDLFPNIGIRSAYKTSELSGAAFAVHNADLITSDYDFSSTVISFFRGYDRSNLYSMEENLVNRSFEKGGLILVRSEMATNPVRVFGLPYKLNYDPSAELIRSPLGFDKVYDNGQATSFV